MGGVAPWRLNLLRAGYLLIVVGMGFMVWPQILDPAQVWEPARGVVVAMFGAMSLLALIGLVRPLAMLPILFWEIGWKAIWLLRVALPQWLDGRMDVATAATAAECLVVVLIVAVIPWEEAWRRYVHAPAEPFRRGAR